MSDRESTEQAAAPDILADVERALALLQSHPDGTVRDAVARLLEGIDAVHRAGLTHLVHAIHGMTGDTLINRLIADPAIRMLLMSYDLVAVDRRLQAEEALDTVRGHLHDHGIDVEIQDVVGGVVYVRIHRSHPAGGETPAATTDPRRPRSRPARVPRSDSRSWSSATATSTARPRRWCRWPPCAAPTGPSITTRSASTR